MLYFGYCDTFSCLQRQPQFSRKTVQSYPSLCLKPGYNFPAMLLIQKAQSR